LFSNRLLPPRTEQIGLGWLVGNTNTLQIRIAGGTLVNVPADLGSITTYVLLEQERWFEKEARFLERWVRPGMTAIDIGANHGVYSLLLARLVGETGRVYAYEPTSEIRRRLEQSRAANGVRQLEIIPFALSDGTREGFLVFGGSSELNALGDEGPGETVQVTSLDLEQATRKWNPPDFVKLDAEGEEERILEGGKRFFAENSPLVMFEIKAGTKVNAGLVQAFKALGYGLYRQVPSIPLLVPFAETEPPDPYELNLFAAKPDRAAQLAQEALLLAQGQRWTETDDDMALAMEALRGQQFAGGFAAAFGDDVRIHPDYRRALAGIAAFRNAESEPGRRMAGLWFALQVLSELCRRQPTLPRLLTLARAASDYGARGAAVKVLTDIVKGLDPGSLQVGEPFWPPCPRYDALPVGDKPGAWLLASTIEQLELERAHSSAFATPLQQLEWLCRTPFASAEMHRRRILHAARNRALPVVPEQLAAESEDNLNFDIWRRGGVPGTRLSRSDDDHETVGVTRP